MDWVFEDRCSLVADVWLRLQCFYFTINDCSKLNTGLSGIVPARSRSWRHVRQRGLNHIQNWRSSDLRLRYHMRLELYNITSFASRFIAKFRIRRFGRFLKFLFVSYFNVRCLDWRRIDNSDVRLWSHLQVTTLRLKAWSIWVLGALNDADLISEIIDFGFGRQLLNGLHESHWRSIYHWFSNVQTFFLFLQVLADVNRFNMHFWGFQLLVQQFAHVSHRLAHRRKDLKSWCGHDRLDISIQALSSHSNIFQLIQSFRR